MVDYLRVTHPSATNTAPEGTVSVRLACVKHAASVNPEPGSNSLVRFILSGSFRFRETSAVKFLSLSAQFYFRLKNFWVCVLFFINCSVFKVHVNISFFGTSHRF